MPSFHAGRENPNIRSEPKVELPALSSVVSALAVLFFTLSAGILPARGQVSRAPVRADTAMAVSARAEASAVGRDLMQAGGNAVDAAVGMGFALAVTYPRGGNIGGGGFMLVRDAGGEVAAIDFREEAPRNASRTMYQNEEGEVVPSRSRVGHLASGVPGTVAGLLHVLEKYGSMSRAEVLQPAIDLAEDGFRLSAEQATRLNEHRSVLAQFPGSRQYFTKDSGEPYRAGERFVQRDLASTLRRIRDDGRARFYRGRTAELIAEEMERGGGLVDEEDLRSYHVVEREPVTATYRRHRIHTMPPPSSGVAIIQLLNAMKPYDLQKMGYRASGTVHLMGEAMRRVYADRAKWLGDPAFFDVPLDTLADPTYMERRMNSFDAERADSSSAIGPGAVRAGANGTSSTGSESLETDSSDTVSPDTVSPDTESLDTGSLETTNYAAVDGEGRAVAVTTTINATFGSKVAVSGAGFLLNNEMDDFSAKPGVPNMYGLIGGEANAIAPGKRMLSSMSPTIVEDGEGRLAMALGSTGGGTIITNVFQILVHVLDYEMHVQRAISAGRVHHQWLPDTLYYEPRVLPRDVRENLTRRGWAVGVSPYGYRGRANGIQVRYGREASDPSDPIPGTRTVLGGRDPRGGDETALGF